MTPQDELQQDRKDLQRGVLVNYGGYAVKAAHPVLIVFLVRAYGAEAFGLFVAVQAVLLVLTRVCALGLDKALLWWVSQQPDGTRLRGARAAAAYAAGLSLLTTLVCLAAAGPIAEAVDAPGGAPALRVMSLALVPMTLLELVLGASMGTKRMGTNVLVRETLLPFSFVLTSLALWPLGWGGTALAIGMVVSYVLSLLAAGWSARRMFASDIDPEAGFKIPKAMTAYAWPMWLAEISNTFLQRLDMWAIAALADLRTVGIYGVVMQFGNTIRSIRRGFDPIVLAIVAGIGAQRDAARLASGLSYATSMVIGTQMPVLVFFIVFARDLLPLYGEGFEVGTQAVVILSSFWVLNGAISLSGIVVSAYGYSRLSLINVLGAAALQAGLLWILVPGYGLNGAAFAVGLTYTALSLVQLVQMKVITHSFNYRSDTWHSLLIGLGTGALLALALTLLPYNDTLWLRGGAFAVYAAVYLLLFLPIARGGHALSKRASASG